MQIRKQFRDLRKCDLLEFPVWEYALDEELNPNQDEHTLRPYKVEPPLDSNSAYFIVRASFQFSNGVVMKGIIKPVMYTNDFLGVLLPYDLSPILVTDSAHIPFCYGAGRINVTEIAKNYRLLGYSSKAVFPITFQSDVAVLDCHLEGSLEGFMYFDDDQTDFFRLSQADIRITK